MSDFKASTELLNTTRMLSAILQLLQDNEIIEVLEKARLLAPQKTQNMLESPIKKDAVLDFEYIVNELLAIQEKLSSRNVARTFATSPKILSRLQCIESRLLRKERNIRIMISVLNMTTAQKCIKERAEEIWANLVRLKSRSIDKESTESLLLQVFQRKFVETSGVLDESQRRKEAWIDQIYNTEKLSAGISFYEGNESIEKDYVKAARCLNAALEAGK